MHAPFLLRLEMANIMLYKSGMISILTVSILGSIMLLYAFCMWNKHVLYKKTIMQWMYDEKERTIAEGLYRYVLQQVALKGTTFFSQLDEKKVMHFNIKKLCTIFGMNATESSLTIQKLLGEKGAHVLYILLSLKVHRTLSIAAYFSWLESHDNKKRYCISHYTFRASL